MYTNCVQPIANIHTFTCAYMYLACCLAKVAVCGKCVCVLQEDPSSADGVHLYAIQYRPCVKD